MKKILVVGDIMLDHYIYGTADRLSPEAPVPVVKFERGEYKLGGAGNVVANLAALGIGIYYYGNIGNDKNGGILRKLLEDTGNKGMVDTVIIKDTTVKTRIIANNQYQIVRIDNDTTVHHDCNLKMYYKPKHKYGVIVVSDYGKGDITADLMDFLKTLDTPIIVDPYPFHASFYKNVFMLTPNEKEWWEMKKYNFNHGHIEHLLVTMGNKGMHYYNDYFKEDLLIPATSNNIVNVSGAGDTVMAVLAYCIANGYNIIKAVKLANMCAGYVCGFQGTTTVPKEMFDKFEKEIDHEEKLQNDTDDNCIPNHEFSYNPRKA